ncbi:MAG: polymer-forming cytoskeletal protein, partial [Deltaproteobacteria bacterium]|nr:polymer-forming cytoskeletal protein [Deltaproteobacteria bacterium]MBW2537417.1 polymer-forming cytoskeletal protein [Deltaproteobacteria bacterium]
GPQAPEGETEPAAAAEQDDEPPPERGEDRVVTGGSAKVRKGEVVHDFAVFGGSAEVLGTVTGDLAVLGGSVTIRKGARVYGDAAALGGSMTIEDHARVDGDVDVLGGKLNLGEHARVGGDVTNGGEGFELGPGKHNHPEVGFSLGRLASDAGSAITRIALLFVFGAVLFGLATRRMERMQTEVAARPMRTLSYGVVGLLVAILICVALCITIIGIPVAIVGLMVGIFATYAGICAVLSAVGAALVQHKSSNPYVHLGVGCLVFLIVGAIPFAGGLATVAVILAGIGVLVTTRAAGFIKPRKGAEGSGPYRRAAETG